MHKNTFREQVLYLVTISCRKYYYVLLQNLTHKGMRYFLFELTYNIRHFCLDEEETNVYTICAYHSIYD